jgi:hypothetical protein
MGKGIVATPADFGRQGEAPSHPELLDWLAADLVENGWSLKQLLRTLLQSQTYKQSSERGAQKDTADPENRLFGRALVRRMDAEALRDSLLVLSGKLNSKMFGAPVPVMLDLSGQVVVGVDTADSAGRPTGKVVPLKGEEFRRSIYVQARRSRPLGMLETFDLPKMEPNCEARSASTVAPQSLTLMNSDFVLEHSRILAERLCRETEADPEARIRATWRRVFGRHPSPDEVQKAAAFLNAQTATLQAHLTHTAAPPPPAEDIPKPAPEAAAAAKTTPKGTPPSPPPTPREPEVDALATLCQALLSSNAFLYVD